LEKYDWVTGNFLEAEIPAHSDALRAGGADFLTAAFHRAGSLCRNNRVTEITQFTEISGGSTGRKLLISVQYEKHQPHLHQDLFIKFSRDYDSPARDAARTQMALEVQFALLSMSPDFPIDVPVCYFADYHHDSGTGILVTQCIPYGKQGFEDHHPKALDYRIENQLEHYQALLLSLARLAGCHKAGNLDEAVERYFSFDPCRLDVSRHKQSTPEQIREKVRDYAEFVAIYPTLFPENIRSEAFLLRLAEEAPRFQSQLEKINSVLHSTPEMVALCHWNAHIDNAWFWRNDDNQLECGLLDWGNVSQMNVAMALWGCLSAAETFIWNEHLDDLLALFKNEFERCGGAAISVQDLKLYLILYACKMGLVWMLDMPLVTLSKIRELPQLSCRFDPLIETNEHARAQILIMSNFLNLWHKSDMGAVIRFLEAYDGADL